MQKDTTSQDSHVVPHHTTNWTDRGLTSEFGWDPVCSTTCGRIRGSQDFVLL